jgi:hypothetical protein
MLLPYQGDLAPTPFLKNAAPPNFAEELNANTPNIRITKQIFIDFAIDSFP